MDAGFRHQRTLSKGVDPTLRSGPPQGPSLRPGPPLLPTDVTNIEILHVYSIILNIDHITCLSSRVCCAGCPRALDGHNMRQCRILPGKFIQQYLISLTRPLLNNGFHRQATLCVVLRIATRATYTQQSSRFCVHVKIVFALGAKLHLLCAFILFTTFNQF